MSIAREMDEALFGLCLLISRATDPQMQAALVRTQQLFEEVRQAVQALEDLACRAPSRPAPVPSSWGQQRAPSEAEQGGGRVVSLEAVRASRLRNIDTNRQRFIETAAAETAEAAPS